MSIQGHVTDEQTTDSTDFVRLVAERMNEGRKEITKLTSFLVIGPSFLFRWSHILD